MNRYLTAGLLLGLAAGIVANFIWPQVGYQEFEAGKGLWQTTGNIPTWNIRYGSIFQTGGVLIGLFSILGLIAGAIVNLIVKLIKKTF